MERREEKQKAVGVHEGLRYGGTESPNRDSSPTAGPGIEVTDGCGEERAPGLIVWRRATWTPMEEQRQLRVPRHTTNSR